MENFRDYLKLAEAEEIFTFKSSDEAKDAAKKLAKIDKKEWEIAGDTIVTTSKKAIAILKDSKGSDV